MKAENLKKNQQKIALLCEVFFSATYVYQLFNVCFHKNPKIKNEKQKYFVKNMKPPCKKPKRSWMLDDEVHILQLWEENYAQLLQVKRNVHNVDTFSQIAVRVVKITEGILIQLAVLPKKISFNETSFEVTKGSCKYH